MPLPTYKKRLSLKEQVALQEKKTTARRSSIKKMMFSFKRPSFFKSKTYSTSDLGTIKKDLKDKQNEQSETKSRDFTNQSITMTNTQEVERNRVESTHKENNNPNNPTNPEQKITKIESEDSGYKGELSENSAEGGDNSDMPKKSRKKNRRKSPKKKPKSNQNSKTNTEETKPLFEPVDKSEGNEDRIAAELKNLEKSKEIQESKEVIRVEEDENTNEHTNENTFEKVRVSDTKNNDHQTNSISKEINNNNDFVLVKHEDDNGVISLDSTLASVTSNLSRCSEYVQEYVNHQIQHLKQQPIQNKLLMSAALVTGIFAFSYGYIYNKSNQAKGSKKK